MPFVTICVPWKLSYALFQVLYNLLPDRRVPGQDICCEKIDEEVCVYNGQDEDGAEGTERLKVLLLLL